MKDKITTEPCGCKFITIFDDDGHFSTYLHECRCKKHYVEQFYIEIDGVVEEYNACTPLPLLIGDSE